MKKILASILVLTMLVCCMSISAFADGAPASLTIADATANAGAKVKFPVSVVVSDDFAAVKLELTIDSDLEGATISKISQGEWTMDNASAFEKNPANGQVVWANSVNTDLEEKGSGTLCTYEISVPADAKNGTYDITLNCYDFCYVDVNNNDKVTTIHGVTTTDTATLTVVGGQDPVVPPHEHVAGSEWFNDAENHWNKCECGEDVNVAAHVYDNDQDATCNTCGYEREVEIPHEHDFSGEWKSDADNHWKVCAADGEIGEKAAHVYADDADATCDTCGATREVEIPHEHVAGSEWANDADNHWNTCECGEKVNVAAHVYADDADTTCDTCGYERTIGGDNTGDDNTGDDGDKDDDKDDNKDDEKDEDKKDDTTDTGDNTNLYIYMALCLFAAAAIVVTSYELKKTRG